MRTDSGSGNDCAVQCGLASACGIHDAEKTKECIIASSITTIAVPSMNRNYPNSVFLLVFFKCLFIRPN